MTSRERAEYRYAFAREQQLVKNKFADEMTRPEKELADRTTEANRQLQVRESAIADRKRNRRTFEIALPLFRRNLDTAISKAVEETTARVNAAGLAREELLTREFARSASA